jgi:hypothetical protein
MHYLFFLLLILTPARGEGVKTHYTDVIQNLISDNKSNTADFALKCWTTPKNSLYIGVEQRVRIHASIQTVSSVVTGFDQYDQLFPGYSKISLVSKTENKSTVYFEQHVPIIFVPNVKYEMLYTELKPTPDRDIFWYVLKSPGTLKSSDGLIILNKVSDAETDYTEYDFFDAEWGLAKVEGNDKLWKDAVEGIYLSDFAMKLKSEKPEISSKEALKTAKHEMNKKLVEDCVKTRSDWVESSK